jgi:glycosyltransferase involved in cell wall biosynthesis
VTAPIPSAAAGASSRTRSHEVLFLPDFRSGNPYQRRLADGLHEHGFTVRFAARDARLMLAREALRRQPLGVVHVHWPENYVAAGSRLRLLLRGSLFLLVLWLMRRRGSKIVWTVHNLEFHEERQPVLEAAFRRRLARLCHALAVHFPAEEVLRRRLRPRPRTPIVETPLGHDPPPASALPLRAPGARPFVFCHAGEIRAYKNVPLIVEAFRGNADPDLRLVVAGRVHDAPLRQRLTELAAGDNRIRLHFGFLAEEDLEACLHDADAFVVGGDDFFTSASALQAAGWGLAVVAPPHPHLASFLAPEGWVQYRPGDAGDLCRALREAAQRRVSGAANRERSLGLTYPRLAAATAALYRALLES